MQIVLLRHGETDWNLQGRCQGTSDVELNQNGFRQAKEAAAHLRRTNVGAVYSSDLKRALQTAHVISRGLPVITDSDFRELNHGEFEGLTFSEIRSHYPDFLARWRTEPAALRVPGGERLVDVEKRAWRGLGRIVQSHQVDDTVVVVSHQFPIAAILCRVAGTPLDQYRSFRIHPGGISHLSFEPNDGWQLIAVNAIGYNDPPASQNKPSLE